MANKNRIGDIIHPCLTPDFAPDESEIEQSRMTLHSKLLQKAFISINILGGIPYDLTIFQGVSLCILSKAFLKSMKLMKSGVFHAMHCSMMFLRVKIWSMHLLPLLKPACSSLSFSSTILSILLRRIL